MATINAPSLQDIVYSGDCPSAYAHGYINLVNAAIGDKVRLSRMYAGSKLYESFMVNAALGASTTVSIGFEYVDGQAGGGAAVLIPATNTAGAARTNTPNRPFILEYDAYITATIGGAAATGQLDVMLDFEFKGTK